ncbi:MAG: hypothetical protein EP329_21405 [Deltaproteobacteria bacterium]|nr:MAG: hypothetical protein EP329_21405 [Deltaproteobacteria bacterium]
MREIDARLLREGLFGITTRGFALVAGLLTSWVTIRFLGAESFGVYVTALAVVDLVDVISSLGLRGALLPELTAARRADAPARLGALVRMGLLLSLLVWLVVGSAVSFLGGPLGSALDAPATFEVAVILLLPFGLFQVWRAQLGGYLAAIGRVQVGFFIDHVVRMLGLLALLGGLWAATAAGVDLPRLPAFALGLSLLELGLFLLIWFRFRPPPADPTAVFPPAVRARVIATALPIALFLTLGAARDVAAKTLLAGLESAFVEVGVLALALKLAAIVPVPQAMLAQSLSPIASNLYQTGDLAGLRRAFQLSTLAGVAGGAAIVVLVGLWGPYVLHLYGAVYDAAYAPLLVLLAARLAAVAFGPTTSALQMVQRTKVLVPTAGLGLGLAIALYLVFIPPYGVVGVAIASACTAVVISGVHAVALWRITGVHAFGRELRAFGLVMVAVGAADVALVLLLGPLWGAVVGTVISGAWVVLHLRWIVRHHGVTFGELVPARLRRWLERRRRGGARG